LVKLKLEQVFPTDFDVALGSVVFTKVSVKNAKN